MEELRWWRRRRPKALGRRDLEQLHQRLIALTPTESSPALPGLVREAIGENGDAAFKIALLLMRENPEVQLNVDLMASWFFWCVHGPGLVRDRARDASRLLLELHAGAAKRLQFGANWRPGDRVAAGRHLQIARAYIWSMPCWVAAFTADVRAAEEGDNGGTDTGEQTWDVEHSTGATVADGPSKRVIQADTLPGPMRMDDRRLIEAYKPVLGELPLAGDPAALPRLADQIAREFPWLEPFTAFLRDELALRQYAGTAWFQLDPLLLVGPPGCGKTLAARRVAELAGVGHDLLSLGGSSDARHVLGTARGWASAQPCGAVVAVQRHGCANPMVILDELEKAGGSDRAGRVQDGLLGMLEPVSARAYYDEALNVPVDLSAVTWIATANDSARINAALASRLTIIEVPGPDGRHLEAILVQLARDVAADLGVRQDMLPTLDAAAMAELRADLEAYQDVRRIVRAYRRAIAAAVQGQARPVDA